MYRNKILLFTMATLLSITAAHAQDQGKFTPRDNSPAEIFGYLDRAVRLVEQKGEAAYAELTDPEGAWVNENWYIYINNFDGYNVAHLNKMMVGKFFFSVRDIKGNAFFAELQKAAMCDAGRGWTKFWWPKPGETEAARKIGFVVRVPGQRLWIGTGAYDMTDEEIKRLPDTSSSYQPAL